MRYYIRRKPDTDVTGPFSVEELTAQLNAGEIPQDTLASSDTGGKTGRIARYRPCDWFPLSAIPELRYLYPAPQPEVETTRPVTLTRLIALALCTAFLAYNAATSENWRYEGLWATGSLVLTLFFLNEYLDQKQDDAP